MLKDYAKTSLVTFFALPIIIIGLLILSYFLYSTLLTQQIESRTEFLGRQVEISIDKIDELVKEFSNEIPFIAETGDFEQVFDLESVNAGNLRYRIKNINKRYGDFIDTLFIYDKNRSYFVATDKNGVVEEGFDSLKYTDYPLQFSNKPKIVHVKGNKSLVIIPTNVLDKGKPVYFAALINVFDLIKTESKQQYIGNYGYKIIFSENMGFRIAHEGHSVEYEFGLQKNSRLRIINELLERKKGNLIHSASRQENVFLTVYYPFELFEERYGLIFAVTDKGFIAPIRAKLQIIFISFFGIITLVIVVFVINVRDVARNTDELENSREGLARALTILEEQQETSRDGLIVADENFLVVSYNKRFANMFEFKQKPVKGSQVGVYLDFICKLGLNHNRILEIKEQTKINSAAEIQEEMQMSDGKTYDFYSSPIVYENAQNFGRIWAFRDITLRKKEIEELRLAKEKALDGAKEKENFLSTMSHEIRTPLNSIVGFANLLLHEDPSEEQKEQLLPLKYSADSLLSLVNDILDLTKIESGGIQFEKIPFNLNEKLTKAQQVFSQHAKEKDIEITLILDQSLAKQYLGDYSRLNQITYNIISNAIKFTTVGSIEVGSKLSSKTAEKEKVIIWIKDSGIGIEKNKQELVFNAFSQADSNTTREYGGTGLGLAITKMLVELQGGKIWIDSELGKGATFFIELDFTVTDQEIKVDNTVVTDKNLNTLNVLLVEDNPFNQKVASKFLGRWGASTVVTDSGEESLEEIKNKNFDVVLMDLQMPGMDGYETARAIRTMEGSYFKNIKIIAMSADALGDIKEKVDNAGMDGYMSKPFDPDQLLSLLAEFKK